MKYKLVLTILYYISYQNLPSKRYNYTDNYKAKTVFSELSALLLALTNLVSLGIMCNHAEGLLIQCNKLQLTANCSARKSGYTFRKTFCNSTVLSQY